MTVHFLGQPIGNPSFIPPVSDWLRHGPFAQWLVHASRPQRIVELGTHYGYSYFSFCEAVESAGLNTDCFAVDTWHEEEDAEHHRPDIYDYVKARNQRYGFSKLLRKTFAEALEDIEDGSVDLLHIDGRHFYEDVKENFENWIPKLSPRAIVLFHDTEAREHGIGVHLYWEELIKQFPSVNFTYQHGLGVIFFGHTFTDEIIEMKDMINSDTGRDLVIGTFTLAGERFILERKIAALSTPLASGTATVLPREIQELSDHINSRTRSLEIQLLESKQTISDLKKYLQRSQKILRQPIQNSIRLNFSKAALKGLPYISETRRAKLRQSIAKRDHRAIFERLNHKQSFGRKIRGTPSRLADAKFSPETSEVWKTELRGSDALSRLAAEQPLVSIIMPTKNRLWRIEAAITSVLAQDYEHWELIIIDDGSDDGTLEAVPARWPDPRIKIMRSEGSGVCDARNTGLQVAKGEIIAYLDDDNRWHPDYLEITLLEMLRSDKACCYSTLRRFPEGFSKPETANTTLVPFDLERLKFANYIDLNVFAHRRHLFETIGGFDTSLRRMVDWDLIIRYCTAYTPAVCNSIGADYEDSRSATRITVKERSSYQFVVRNKHMIDWASLRREAAKREADLVSVIICVYDNPEHTDKCLASLFQKEAGLPFEVVIVDNGSNDQTVALLKAWADREPRIRLLLNPENMNFSLGNNLGFAMSRGEKVVFLNNDTEVTPEWLRALLEPMQDPDIRGVQPQLVFPDGTVQCMGLVFSEYSPFAYGIHAGRPGDDPLVSSRRRFRALTAACIALRAQDFADLNGFDPLFVNGQEDVDLCLRLGKGKPVFTCAMDSVVIHHESKSEGRGYADAANRAIFSDRWTGRITGDDRPHYAADGVKVEKYAPHADHLAEIGLATQIPRLTYPAPPAPPLTPAVLGGVTGFRLRIPCPRPALKDRWGDYHFAVAMAKAAARIGLNARIDFLENWSAPAEKGEADLVLRGLSAFPETAPAKGRAPRLMWMISHPDKITDTELDSYDQLFVASSHWAEELNSRGLKPVISTLLQCTEIERFNLSARAGAPHHERLYVGNSRKVLRSTVAKAIAENLPLDIYGEMWEGLAPAEWVHAENVPNVQLPSFYAGADVVLNDHWDTMRSHGFVSNRIFDVLATGAPLVTDSVAGMPVELSEACTILEDGMSLRDATAAARARHSLAERNDIAAWIAEHHGFGARLRAICAQLG